MKLIRITLIALLLALQPAIVMGKTINKKNVKHKQYKAIPKVGPVSNVTNLINEKELVAAVTIAEAGGEGKIGLLAVYEVILTRAKQRNVSEYRIVTERHAFSCLNGWKNKQSFINKWKKHPMYLTALEIVKTHKSTKITAGCNYYHEKSVHPIWSRGETPKVIIGKHLFFALVY